METVMAKCEDNRENFSNFSDLSRYYTCQCKIPERTRLYKGKEHHPKVVMLFAEVYAFLTKYYDIEDVSNMIGEYQNTYAFTHWFWETKHYLGELLRLDPNEFYIGEWLGRGFFLKITLSILAYNNLVIDQEIIRVMIEKQKKIIEKLNSVSNDNNNDKYCVIIPPSVNISQNINGYTLLGQDVIYSFNRDIFFENII